jgi:hypothetical protein
MTIHINYPTQEEKDASLAEERQRLAALQEQLALAEEDRSATGAARRVARQELISAKAGLITAQQSGIDTAIASADASVAAAQVNLDRAVGIYDNAKTNAENLFEKVTNAENTLANNTKAPIFEQSSSALQAEAPQTADSAVEDTNAREDLTPEEKKVLDTSAASNAGDEPAPVTETQVQPAAVTEMPEVVVTASRPEKTPQQERIKPRRNPLHDYATYTYSIALYILTKEDINTLTVNPAVWEPGTGKVNSCLIASGGKNTGRYVRNPNFTDDFYFDNLKMTTMIGMNSRSKSSNAIEISFTILEPYGMSLLDRIMQTAEDIRAPNFKAMPYLLEIEFYGFDDAGTAIQVSEQRKRLPVQIIEMKIKVGSKGAEYAIKAIPWNHQALSQSAATTPINLEVKASTVQEFFYNNLADLASVAGQDAKKMDAQSHIQRKESEQKAAEDANRAAEQERANQAAREQGVSEKDIADYKVSPAARKPDSQDIVDSKGVVNHAFAVSSYCGGVNAWYTDLIIKKLRATADAIRFEFHRGPLDCPYDIASSKISVPEQKDISRAAVKEDKPEDAAKAAAKSANRVFTDATAFAISAGTSIPQVIDMVMRNSSYITDQIKDPKNMQPQELAEKEGKPLWWYKVVPSIEIKEYDYAMNKFSSVTTYHIMPYRVFDSKHPNGPSAAPRGAIKEYFYSYTGKNIDVLDLQIDFDTLFYTSVTAGAAKWQADQATVAAQQQQDNAAKAAKENPDVAKELVNRQLRLVSTQPQSTGVGGTQNGVKPVLAADIQKGLYSTQRGDMLNLKLKITGDPELIKQDDIYTNPAQGGYANSLDSNGAPQNGSVDMDNGEILALVEFKTIVDMDEETGQPRKQTDAQNSVFTGLYRMLDIENTFAGGRFEQVVNMVRVPDALNEAANNADKGKAQQNSEALTGKDESASSDARTPDNNENNQGDNFAPTPVQQDNPADLFPATNSENADNSTGAGIVDQPENSEPNSNDLRSINEQEGETPIDQENTQQAIGQPAPSYTGPAVVYATDGSSSPVDSLGNVLKPLVNGSYA